MMKRLFIICILTAGAMLNSSADAQVILQKAVISNGGGVAANGSTAGMFVVGQTAAGMASNSGMIGHFGFFATPNAANSVANHGSGAISSLQLTPNPASDQVGINVTLANAENVDLFLYDATGHFVSTVFSGKKEAGAFTTRFDVRSLASGTYFVAARIPGAMMQAKLNVVK
jgi:hypothetical protein